MLEPRSIHEFARELQRSSARFVAMFAEYEGGNRELYGDLAEESKRGTDLLNTLVLNIRNEMDFGRLQVKNVELPTAGVLMKRLDSRFSAAKFKREYSGVFAELLALDSFQAMNIREVLNKLAHFDKSLSDFLVSDQTHQLLLLGKKGSENWFCVVDIGVLVTALLALPDQNIQK